MSALGSMPVWVSGPTGCVEVACCVLCPGSMWNWQQCAALPPRLFNVNGIVDREQAPCLLDDNGIVDRVVQMK